MNKRPKQVWIRPSGLAKQGTSKVGSPSPQTQGRAVSQASNPESTLRTCSAPQRKPRGQTGQRNQHRPQVWVPFLPHKSILQAREAVVCVLVVRLCLTLCDPVSCSPPSYSVHGLLQDILQEYCSECIEKKKRRRRMN